MLYRCPFCGFELVNPVLRGLTLCSHCNAIVEGTDRNKLLGAAWELLKRKTPLGLEEFKFQAKLPPDKADYVFGKIMEEGYSYDEFLKEIA